MEQWTYHKYRLPRLTATAVLADSATGTITLATPSGEYDIDGLDGVQSAAELSQYLQNLMDPRSDTWTGLRGSNADEELSRLVLQLDDLGLLEETAARDLSDHTAPLLAAMNTAVAFVSSHVSADTKKTFAQNAALLRNAAESLMNDYLAENHPSIAQGTRVEVKDRDPIRDQNNFFLLTLELQLRNFRRNCPMALAAAVSVLGQIERLEDRSAVPAPKDDAASLIDRLYGEGFDVQGPAAYMLGLAELLVRSAQKDAKRLCVGTTPVPEHQTGLQFILYAETVATESLLRLGPPRVLDAIKNRQMHDRLIKGCFIQEYIITRRFVEIITPLLSKRMSPELRGRLFRYYGEEFGHEEMELQTCRSLGIDAQELMTSFGLPLHEAFVDIFTYLATSEPLAFMTSVFLTEGMTRARSPLGATVQDALAGNKRFIEVSGRHENLNDQLNHPSLSRLFLADVPSIDSRSQRRALAYLLYLVELNFRTWEGLYEYYIREDTPLHYVRPYA